LIDSSDEDFEQPSNEEAQGNVLSMRRMDIDGEDDIKQTPNQQPKNKNKHRLHPKDKRDD
jgi:hypothetical protein